MRLRGWYQSEGVMVDAGGIGDGLEIGEYEISRGGESVAVQGESVPGLLIEL